MPQVKETLDSHLLVIFSLFHFLPNPVALLTVIERAKPRQVAEIRIKVG